MQKIEFKNAEELGAYINNLHGKNSEFLIKYFPSDRWWPALTEAAESVRIQMLNGTFRGAICVPVDGGARNVAIEYFEDILRGANSDFEKLIRQCSSDCRTARLDLMRLAQMQAIVAGALLNALRDGKSFEFCRELCKDQALRAYKNDDAKLAENWIVWQGHSIMRHE